ncbi:MAG: TonB-dependent receptor [Pseudomonadota bacterium]
MRHSLRFYVSQVALACALSTALVPWFTASSQAQSEPQERQAVNIPAAPLEDAISAVARAFDIDILVPGELVAGKIAPGISGSLTADQAITRVLRGSGLSFRRSPSGGYIVQEEIAQARPNTRQRALKSIDETIIVTGTKQYLSLQDTYVSVSVLTEQKLDERAIYALEDILLRTPSLTTSNEGLFNFAIRGIGSGGVRGNVAVGRTSNVYLDGAPITAEGSLSAFNLWDVSQVEVLRGPQSTIQGRNSLAGAIVVQTADPEYDFSARFRGLIAEDNTYQASAMVTGPIITDQIAFRLAADYREEDFNTLNSATGTFGGDNDSTTIRGKLLFEPEALAGLRLELGIQYIDNFTSGTNRRFGVPGFGTIEAEGFDVFDRVGFDPRDGRVQNENIRYFADLQYEISPEWKVVTLATYDDTERAIINNGGDDVRTDEVFSFDARVEFNFDTFKGWFGGYYYNDTLNSAVDQVFDLTAFGAVTNPPGATVSQQTNRDLKTENYAIYGDVTVDVTDQLSVNVGARYDWETSNDTGIDGNVVASVDPCIVTAPILPGPVPCAAPFAAFISQGLLEEGDYSAFLPRASIVYRFDEDRSVAFSVARGYRAGGFNPGNDVLEEFDPEFLTNYELAFRSQWLDQKLTVNANIFYADYEDIQVALPTPLGLSSDIINGAEAELYGAEFSLNYQFAPELDVFFDIALLESEFIDFPFAVDDPVNRNPLPGDPGFANLAGNSFAQAPGVSAAFGANYDDGSIFGSFIVNYTDGVFSDFTNLEPDRTDSYFITNARLGYRYGKAQISVFVENVFNEEFITTQNTQAVNISNGVVSVGPGGVGLAFISPPRTIGAEFEVRF